MQRVICESTFRVRKKIENPVGFLEGEADAELIERIEKRLEAIEAKTAALVAAEERTSGHALNPENEIGGIRSRSPRQKRRILDRWDRQAKERIDLEGQKSQAEAELRAARGAPLRKAAEAVLAERVRALAPGDPVWCGYPEPATVVRVNKKSVSVVTAGGYADRVEIGLCAPAARPADAS